MHLSKILRYEVVLARDPIAAAFLRLLTTRRYRKTGHSNLLLSTTLLSSVCIRILRGLGGRKSGTSKVLEKCQGSRAPKGKFPQARYPEQTIVCLRTSSFWLWKSDLFSFFFSFPFLTIHSPTIPPYLSYMGWLRLKISFSL